MMVNVYFNVGGSLVYALILLAIIVAKDKAFRTPFWIFFVSGGIYGILCIVGYDFKWYWDLPTSVIQRALSTITAIGHTIAKFYVVISRYAVFRSPNLTENLQTRTIVLMLVGQFVIPIMVASPLACAQPTGNGTSYGPPYLITIVQTTSAVIYGSYVVIGTVLTAFSLQKLRNLMKAASEKKKRDMMRQEALILCYSIVLFLSHSLKCVQQIIFASFPSASAIQTITLMLYPYINELAVFTSPIMMLLISGKLRRLLLSYIIRAQMRTTTVNPFSSNNTIKVITR